MRGWSLDYYQSKCVLFMVMAGSNFNPPAPKGLHDVTVPDCFINTSRSKRNLERDAVQIIRDHPDAFTDAVRII